MSIVSKTTAGQIIEDISIRLPHEYDEKTLFRWINETMKKIYKDLAIQSQYSFLTRENQQLYSLPEDCSIDMISYVTKSTKARNQDNPYNWGEFNQLHSYLPEENMIEEGYYDGREGLLGLYPCPNDVRKNLKW